MLGLLSRPSCHSLLTNWFRNCAGTSSCGNGLPNDDAGWFEPHSELPILAAGENPVMLACEGLQGLRSRAKVTLISYGEPFGGSR